MFLFLDNTNVQTKRSWRSNYTFRFTAGRLMTPSEIVKTDCGGGGDGVALGARVDQGCPYRASIIRQTFTGIYTPVLNRQHAAD